MAYIFCVANQKGGVGKTTTAVNTAAALARRRQKVLLIDLDAQGNATMGSGVEKNDCELTVYQLLIGEASFDEVVKKSPSGGYDLIPANRDLSAAEIDLMQLKNPDKRLKAVIDQIADRYDFILIDCPPSLSMITVNALCCARGVIIPMQCEYFALEGLSDLMHTVRMVRRSLNPGLDLEGVLLTMFDGRTNLALQVAEEVKRYFPGKVYSTVIPRNVRLSEAPSHGKPINYYDRTSRGAEAYSDLANEFLKQNK